MRRVFPSRIGVLRSRDRRIQSSVGRAEPRGARYIACTAFEQVGEPRRVRSARTACRSVFTLWRSGDASRPRHTKRIVRCARAKTDSSDACAPQRDGFSAVRATRLVSLSHVASFRAATTRTLFGR
jgi:hypothetical protein